jgi:hypothetical protein
VVLVEDVDDLLDLGVPTPSQRRAVRETCTAMCFLLEADGATAWASVATMGSISRIHI